MNVAEATRWHVDDGHGWLEVPAETCDGVRVSAYSYRDTARGLVYLEEDCDAPAWARFHGVPFSAFREVPRTVWYGDCFVRDLERVAR